MHVCVVGWNWRRRLGGCEAKEGLLAAALAALGITSCLAPCVTLAAWHGHAGEMIQMNTKRLVKTVLSAWKLTKFTVNLSENLAKANSAKTPSPDPTGRLVIIFITSAQFVEFSF